MLCILEMKHADAIRHSFSTAGLYLYVESLQLFIGQAVQTYLILLVKTCGGDVIVKPN